MYFTMHFTMYYEVLSHFHTYEGGGSTVRFSPYKRLIHPHRYPRRRPGNSTAARSGSDPPPTLSTLTAFTLEGVEGVEKHCPMNWTLSFWSRMAASGSTNDEA